MLFFNANMAEAEGFKEVILTKHDVFGFGFSVIGGSQYDLPPVISDILDGSPADLCNDLEIGDILVAVNQVDVSFMSPSKVVSLICRGGLSVKLKVKPDSAVKQRTKCAFCDGSETLQTERSQTASPAVNGLIVKHKQRVDNNLTYNVKHSLIRDYPNRSQSAASKMNVESPSSATASERFQNSAGCKTGVGGSPFSSEGESFRSPGKREMGRKVNGCSGGGGVGSTVIRTEPRFETFLMTGDMIIKTTNVSCKDRTVRMDEAKVSDEFQGYEDFSPVPSPPPSTGSHQSPLNGASLQDFTSVPESLSGVGRNKSSSAEERHEHLSTDCRRKLVYDLPSRDDGGCPVALPPPELLGCPRFSNIPIELDIPPDDISSEDERCRLEAELNIDDLPPPPDEFLSDFVPPQTAPSFLEAIPSIDSVRGPTSEHLNSDSHWDSNGAAVGQFPLLRGNTNTQDTCIGSFISTPLEFCDQGGRSSSNVERENFFFNAGVGAGSAAVKSMIVSSRSEERLSPRMVSEKSALPQDIAGIVRGSKSQENYLQHDNDGIVVDIDFGEHAATSVDTLHYTKSSSGIDSFGYASDRAIRSLHNSPEKRAETVDYDDRQIIQTSFGSVVASKAGDDQGIKSGDKPTAGKPGAPPAPPERGVSSLGSLSTSHGSAVIETYFGGEQLPPPPESFQTSGEACVSINLANGANASGNADGNASVHDRDKLGSVSKATGNGLSPSPHELSVNCIKSGDGSNGEATVRGGSEQTDERKRPSDTDGSAIDDDFDDSFRHPIKDVDRPSAQRLAKRLYCLEGFQKTDVAKHLWKKNDFAQLVGEEYLKHFDFKSQSLDAALRSFLQHLVLSGETQERERILVHFSHRFLECNSGSFSSEDSCHTLTCAMLLLNTDLHRQNAGKKMTVEEFIENLADLNDGDDFPKDLLRSIYRSIQNEPIEFEIDETEMFESGPKGPSCTLGGNPFLDVLDPSKAKEFKNGYVMRKCCIDPDGRRTALGKRSWKMFYVTLRDLVLYLYKDQQALNHQTHFHTSNNAIRIHHSLATIADDYKKKQHVFRLQTTDGAEYLFQTSNSNECQSWIGSINFVAAALSSPPLPSAVGSQRKFQRPLMPSSVSKLSLGVQLSQHSKMLKQIENDLCEHAGSPPDKGSKSRMIQDYLEKESYLQFEQKRFTTYCSMIEAKLQSPSRLSELSSMEVTIGEADETNVGNAALQNDSQKSAAVQRSMSDRLSRPFMRQNQNPTKNYSSMHSAKSMPSIFQPRKSPKARTPTATWYMEAANDEDEAELTYC